MKNRADLQSCNVDHDIIAGEVVEHVALGPVAKRQKTSQRHDQAGQHGDGSGEVGDAGEAVESGFLEGAVDEEAVVVADESWGLY